MPALRESLGERGKADDPPACDGRFSEPAVYAVKQRIGLA